MEQLSQRLPLPQLSSRILLPSYPQQQQRREGHDTAALPPAPSVLVEVITEEKGKVLKVRVTTGGFNHMNQAAPSYNALGRGF